MPLEPETLVRGGVDDGLDWSAYEESAIGIQSAYGGSGTRTGTTADGPFGVTELVLKQTVKQVYESVRLICGERDSLISTLSGLFFKPP